MHTKKETFIHLNTMHHSRLPKLPLQDKTTHTHTQMHACIFIQDYAQLLQKFSHSPCISIHRHPRLSTFLCDFQNEFVVALLATVAKKV